MGWLCSTCGTENRFREARCCACLSKGNLKSRVTGLGITLYERFGANRLGTFAETAWDKVRRYVGSANRAAGISIAIGVVCAAVMLLIMSAGIARSGIPAFRLNQLGQRMVQCVDRAGETLTLKAQHFAQFGIEWERPVQRLGQRGEALMQGGVSTAEELVQRIARAGDQIGRNMFTVNLLLRGAAGKLSMFWEMIFSKLPEMDIYFVMWLMKLVDAMKAWIYEQDIEWLRGAAEWGQSVRDWLVWLMRTLRKLRV